MFIVLKPLDLYAYEKTLPLSNFGVVTIKYEFRKYNDVRNLVSAPAYMLVCTQRVIVAGSMAYTSGPIMAGTNYSNYPAIIVSQIIPTVNISGATAVVKTMFPKTLNSAVNTSFNEGGSSSSGTNYQTTSGSSTSTTNTFNISLDPFQRSKESGTFTSAMSGTTASQESSISSGDAMSIKDWSSYGSLTGNQVTWIWGQTYPWDVLQYNQNSNSTSKINGDPIITLPSFVLARLLDGSLSPSLVLPPSSLSLFGCDFTMRAGWLIEFPNGITSSETVQLKHDMICYHASHGFDPQNNNAFEATLQTPSDASPGSYTTPQPLDMSTYALDPITTPSAKNGAIIGFTSNNFTYGPTSGSEFKIISPANTLQVTGSGFDAGLTNAGLTTTFTQTTLLNVQFKIIDSVSAYSLLLKHWIGLNCGACQMTFTVNQEQPITMYVDATEGMGAQNNLSVIDLRNMNFASINFHDYLVVGLNTIAIEIAPVDSGADNQYTLFALAVGRA